MSADTDSRGVALPGPRSRSGSPEASYAPGLAGCITKICSDVGFCLTFPIVHRECRQIGTRSLWCSSRCRSGVGAVSIPSDTVGDGPIGRPVVALCAVRACSRRRVRVSFPLVGSGGMENPRLSFISPTVLAGDRSLTDVIAHELAHSWSGNLVTNASWEELWINEGFTVYFENRIMEEIYGREYEQMMVTLSLGELREEFDRYGWDHPDTRLKIDLKDRDPDSSFTSAAYTKGALFILNAEQQLGRKRWDRFLNDYFDTFAFQSMSTEKFLKYLDDKLIAGDGELEARLNITRWIQTPGLPDSLPHIHSPVLEVIRGQALDFSAGLPAAQIGATAWTTHHWLQFLRQLPDDIGVERMRDLDREFDLIHSGNAEILFEWLRLSILNQYAEAYPALEDFLTSVGRLKFIIPLYRELQSTADGRSMAMEFYSQARSRYHSVAWYILDPIVGYESGG